MAERPEKKGWGVENLPYPEGLAYIQARWDLCVGCGICEAACSFHHYGVVNRELSRIRIYRYLTPIPKSVQNVCVQCRQEERECEKACPVKPSAIYFDEKALHMVVDRERCVGYRCAKCQKACPAEVPRFYPPEHNYALVCDLCAVDGECRPQCVEVCPFFALEFLGPEFPQHLERIHPDVKAEAFSRRLYPLPLNRVHKPPEKIWRDYHG